MIEQRLAENPNSISSTHLAAHRICRAAPMIVWAGELQKAIILLLRSHPGYFKNDWAEARPFWIKIPEDKWARIRRMIQVVRDHQIWMERNNQVVNAISSTKQKDWKEILLDGRLTNRTEQLFATLTYNKMHEVAIS
jgi:N-acyl-D-aspartate/D-glutamate deacylase